MTAEDEELLSALRERLGDCEQKQGRMYARLQDAREQIARLKEDLEECVSEAREHIIRLTKEDRELSGEPGNRRA
jgi:hypothetical protein